MEKKEYISKLGLLSQKLDVFRLGIFNYIDILVMNDSEVIADEFGAKLTDDIHAVDKALNNLNEYFIKTLDSLKTEVKEKNGKNEK